MREPDKAKREIEIRKREIERDFFYFFESASGKFEPATPA